MMTDSKLLTVKSVGYGAQRLVELLYIPGSAIFGFTLFFRIGPVMRINRGFAVVLVSIYISKTRWSNLAKLLSKYNIHLTYRY